MPCKHSICGVCGGKKTHTKYIGIGATLNDVCSSKCQAAQKEDCTCKCEGKFHKGANSALLEFLLEPNKIEKAKKTSVFQPITIYDYLAEFLNGKRINTKSFDRYSDKNYRKDNKKLTLFWLSQKGSNIDTLANDFISESGFNNYSEQDIINAIVNYINDYPSGIKQYIKDVEAERIREQEYYRGDYYGENYSLPLDENGNMLFGANMKFKKGSKEAKAYMAKLRAKKGKKTTAKKINSVGAPKNSSKLKMIPTKDNLERLKNLLDLYKKDLQKETQKDFILFYKNEIKIIQAAINKIKKQLKNKVGATLIIEENETRNTKPTRIIKRTRSGAGTFKSFSDAINGLFDTTVIKDLDSLKKEYLKLANKYHPDKGGTTAQFQELEAEYRKYRDALIKGSSLNAEQKANEIQLDEALMQAVNAIASLSGINIELAGKWLWVSGNTYPIRNELKAAGFMFAPVKKMWYYKGTESAGRGKYSMEEIRNKYGSTKIEPKPKQQINGIGKISTTQKSKLKAALKKVAKALDKRAI